jgi:hypothetical protein
MRTVTLVSPCHVSVSRPQAQSGHRKWAAAPAGSPEAPSFLIATNKKYPVGVHHSLTENLTLRAEFTDTKAEAHNGAENDNSNFNVGAYLSF